MVRRGGESLAGRAGLLGELCDLGGYIGITAEDAEAAEEGEDREERWMEVRAWRWGESGFLESLAEELSKGGCGG